MGMRAPLAGVLIAVAAGVALWPGNGTSAQSTLRPGVYTGRTDERLPIRLATDRDARRLSFRVDWAVTCGDDVKRTERRLAVAVRPDGSFDHRGRYVVPGDDGDEERYAFRLTGRAYADGSIRGTWLMRLSLLNGQEYYLSDRKHGVHPCKPVRTGFRAQRGGATGPPPPTVDGAGRLVVALRGVPRRVGAEGDHVWTRGDGTGNVTEHDAATGRVLRRVRTGDAYFLTAAGEGAFWLGSGLSISALQRVDAGSGHVTTVTSRERDTTAGSGNPIGTPDAVVAGEGAVWSLGYDRLRRGDPRTGEKTAEVRLPRDPRSAPLQQCPRRPGAGTVAVGGGAVWVTATTESCKRGSPRLYALYRIDPQTARVVAIVPLRRAYERLAVDAEGLWATTYLHPALHHLDPSDGRPLSVTPLAKGPDGSVTGIALDAGHVWVGQRTGERAGVLQRVDRGGGGRTVVLRTTGEPSNVAVAGGRAWVADRAQRTLTGVPVG